MHGQLITYLFLLPFFGFITQAINYQGPSNIIPQGNIRGIWKKTINGRRIQAFLGIPYAKPPIGPLRFKNPVPCDGWDGIRDGTKEPSLCLQFKGMVSLNFRIIGSEDCLYLNVYTPSIATPGKYPVMVFIHGGAYLSGGCISDYYGPDMLLDKDIVLVTINYRLGVLGFASTEDEEMPGNYGLKDQNLALKWVKENIGYFGGNPDSITLFGGSSGAASVHFHMLSPLSEGLFHRSILMSGSADCPWALSPRGYIAEQTERLGSFVNCTCLTSKELIDCLRNKPAKLFLHSLLKYFEWPGLDPMIVFRPVLECGHSKDPFITRKSYLNATSNKEMMIGVTSEEGTFKVSILYATKRFNAVLSQLNNEWLDLAPYTMFYEDSATNIDTVSTSIRNYYLQNKRIDRRAVPQLVKMFSDSWYNYGALSAIRRHQGPAYAYKFAHKGDNTVTFLATNSTFNYGVSHADDLIYLFPLKNWLSRHIGFSKKDKAVSDRMVELFTNFATHGRPTKDGKSIQWKPYTSPYYEYMIIQGENYRMDKNFLLEIDNLWKNLPWRSKIFDNSTSTMNN